MKLKRGAALPGAIILCTLMILVSLALSTIFLDMSATNYLHRNDDEKSLIYAESFNKFKLDGSVPSNTSRFTWKSYADENVKALVAYEGSTVAFYAIIYRDTKVLAYQESNIYIDAENKLGGIVPISSLEE